MNKAEYTDEAGTNRPLLHTTDSIRVTLAPRRKRVTSRLTEAMDFYDDTITTKKSRIRREGQPGTVNRLNHLS